jgi:hypothetical protein
MEKLGGNSNFRVNNWNFTAWIKYFTFKHVSKVPLSRQMSSCYLFKSKQGLRIRQMLMKSAKHTADAYLRRCVTVRLFGITGIYILESNI